MRLWWKNEANRLVSLASTMAELSSRNFYCHQSHSTQFQPVEIELFESSRDPLVSSLFPHFTALWIIMKLRTTLLKNWQLQRWERGRKSQRRTNQLWVENASNHDMTSQSYLRIQFLASQEQQQELSNFAWRSPQICLFILQNKVVSVSSRHLESCNFKQQQLQEELCYY